jgi:GTP cyclohydrolase I
MLRGYQVDIASMLQVQFDGIPTDQMIVLRDVQFVSVCEHHLLPFVGKADVAYIPQQERVVGLSKLARLVDAHSQRLQVQERMTHNIANDLFIHLGARGAACKVTASHTCMSCRGVRKPGAAMVTSALLGMFKTATVRAEFFALTS